MKKTNILLLISFFLLFSILSKIGFVKLYQIVISLDPKILLFAFSLDLLMFLTWNLKFKFVVDDIEKIGFFKLLPISMAGAFVNTITPGVRTGGGVVKAHYLSKMTGKEDSAYYAANIVDKVTYSIIFGLISVFAILSAFLFLNVPRTISIILEVFLLIIFFVILSGYYVQKKMKKTSLHNTRRSLLNFLPKIYHFFLFEFIRKKFSTYIAFEKYVMWKIDQFVQTLKNLLRDQNKIKRQFFLGLVILFLLYFKTYVLFGGFGLQISFLKIVTVVTLSILISYFVIVPGGIGVIEAAMISLYVAFGINSDIAAAVAVLDRMIYYVFSLGIGYLSLLYLQFKHKKSS